MLDCCELQTGHYHIDPHTPCWSSRLPNWQQQEQWHHTGLEGKATMQILHPFKFQLFFQVEEL